MTRTSKTTLLAAIALGTALMGVESATAGGGGGCSRSRGGYRRAPSYSYRAPVYRSPSFYQPQPTLQQPTFPQPSSGTPVQQQIQQPTQTAAAPQGTPVLRSNVNPGQTQTAPAAANSTNVAAAGTPAQGGSTPQASTTTTAQMSALQALGGFAPPAEDTPTANAQPQKAAHIGNWTATLPNGSNVQLALQNDGSFAWTATNQSGKSSSFQGTYAVGNGALTLIRSTDNQKLAGNMTASGSDGFSFKLNGSSNAATLNFQRG